MGQIFLKEYLTLLAATDTPRLGAPQTLSFFEGFVAEEGRIMVY